MNVLRRLWRDKGPVVVGWLFARFVTVLRLQPGDVVFVYDGQLLDQLAKTKVPIPFKVPLIMAEGAQGDEILLIKQMDFKEFTKLYQIALNAHQEALCQSQVREG